ncbi:MAG: branched-chain amino acid transport system ATP-binding protein livF, partial [Actinomycetota bacterium]|nr:branched-chain amino acid transport system ATP-binding protein livF [Actinomycetota bacterium]
TGLIGPNGAGKTTVIDALTGFVPASGSVVLGGVTIGHLPAHRRARLGLARTFQALELFADLTVGENLVVAAEASRAGRRRAAGTDPVTALQGAGGAADLLPDRLTSAQRSRVALGRAMATSPSVLLLDEPAAGLDSAERDVLARRLRKLAGDGVAVLLVDHDLSLVLGVCDTVHVLDRGRVVATGSPEVLRADPNVRAAYLGVSGSSPAAGATRERAEREGAPPALAVAGLTAGYGAVEVVRDVNLLVQRGEVVALLGRNGAGKTTTLLSITGALRRTAGTVEVAGVGVRPGRPHATARRGVASVPQERSLFTQLSVAENLRLAVRGGRAAVEAETVTAVERFPALADILGRRVGLLSGGEQRMVALARGLASHPRLLLVDEVSLGLAPHVVDAVGNVLRAVADGENTAILLVEQLPEVARAVADRAYVMDRGAVVAEGPADEVSALPEIRPV